MNTPTLYSVERDADTLIVVIHEGVGSLAGAEILSQFRGVVEQVRESGVTGVVVDLGEVNYFGSILLEALLQVWNELHAAGGTLALCQVSKVGTEILELAKFDTLWPICGTRVEAVETVRK